MQPRRITHNRCVAFTLVELLVVVAILALLMSLLMPTLAGAKESARQAYCLNNQSGIAKGLNLYVGDYATFPYNYATYEQYSGTENVNGVTLTRNRWALMCLAQYLGGTKGVVAEVRDMQEGQYPGMYVCPSADLSAVYTGAPSDRYHACYWTNVAIRLNQGWRTSVPGSPLLTEVIPSQPSVPGDNEVWVTPGYNGGMSRIFGSCPDCPNWRSVYAPKPEHLDLPAGTVFTGDTRNSEFIAGMGVLPGRFDLSPGWGGLYLKAMTGFDRHGGKVMLGYVDGHAAPLTEQEFDKDPKTNDGYSAGRFLIKFTRGCKGTRMHSLPAAPVQ